MKPEDMASAAEKEKLKEIKDHMIYENTRGIKQDLGTTD